MKKSLLTNIASDYVANDNGSQNFGKIFPVKFPRKLLRGRIPSVSCFGTYVRG